MDNTFNDAFDEVIGLEGGYSDDPDDAGGETNWGISKRSYPNVNIATLTKEDAKQIYWEDFWNRLLLSQVLQPSIAAEIFEQAVNFGGSQAVIHVQYALRLMGKNLIVDGQMGPTTLGHIASLPGKHKDAYLKCLNGLQFIKYREIVENNPSQKKYFVGWLRRVALG